MYLGGHLHAKRSEHLSVHLKSQVLRGLAKVLLKHTAMYHGDVLVDDHLLHPFCHLADDFGWLEDFQTIGYQVPFCVAE